MLNLMMLTAALSLPYDPSLTNIPRLHNKSETYQVSINQSALIPLTFDKQNLEAEIDHQLSRELLKLHKHLDDELSSYSMWVNK